MFKKKYNIINCTNKDIVLNDGTVFKANGIKTNTWKECIPSEKINGIQIFTEKYGKVIGIPPPKFNTLYIVSASVLAACEQEGRNDVIAPATTHPDTVRTRGIRGDVLSVPGFVRVKKKRRLTW